MYSYALLAVCVACTLAHPHFLECGNDQTSKLRAGQTIMGQIVTQDSGDGVVKIIADHETITVTSSNPEQHFALKAWGDGAELKSCSSGLTQTKAAGLFGQKCASQFYMDDYLPSVPSFTCKHNGATGFAVAYAKGSWGAVLLATHGPQPKDTIQLSSNLSEAVGDSLTSLMNRTIATSEDKCHKAAESCFYKDFQPCCYGLYCDKSFQGTCKSHPAGQCLKANDYCDYNGAPPCCEGSFCSPGTHGCLEGKPCVQEGRACSVDDDCCSCMGPLGIGIKASCNAKQCACPNQVIV